MRLFHKNVLRTAIISSYLLVIGVLIFGISSVFSYLNTGADRSKMLHTEIRTSKQYTPKVYWATLNNEGLEKENIANPILNQIKFDYLDAWYVRHVAYKTNTTAGLQDYFTESARINLLNTIAYNKKQNITIDATTLEHHLTLDFFSTDRKLAVISDRNVVEFKRVYKDEQLIIETTEVADYQMVFLLEDGFWRIRHLVRKTIEDYHPDVSLISGEHLNMHGINYYPQATPWNMFGDDFDLAIIEKDFKIITDADLNTIRIFVQYEDFGKANVKPEKLKKLKLVLDAAEKHKLKVVLTLFDFYGDYSVLDLTLSQRHAETIVSAFKDHNAIIAWDLKNEPNLDFPSRGKNNVMHWLKSMIILVKSIDKNHAVTVGWSNVESATLLKDELDYISFHYYEDLADFETAYTKLKSQIPEGKPIILGEFGVSSYSGIWNGFSGSQQKQADYYKTISPIVQKYKIPFLSWTLYDFTEVPTAVIGSKPWRVKPQKKYGFITSKGKKKKSFELISMKKKE